MSNFIELRQLQLEIIEELKGKGYQKLLIHPEYQKIDLPKKYAGFSMWITRSIKKDMSVSLVVKFSGAASVQLPPIFEQLIGGKVEVTNSASEDGFDLLPDGDIIDMHDDLDDTED